mmetsp:Transcript_15374/g.33813  ORF Transcript_15374/g.33813 Transcript_15374/m.33813 type:complete len:94 (+) Transcript_15374:1400-1681(+)
MTTKVRPSKPCSLRTVSRKGRRTEAKRGSLGVVVSDRTLGLLVTRMENAASWIQAEATMEAGWRQLTGMTSIQTQAQILSGCSVRHLCPAQSS